MFSFRVSIKRLVKIILKECGRVVNKRFKEVIEAIKKKYNVSQNCIAKVLDEKVDGLTIDGPKMTQYKTTYKEIPKEVIDALEEIYNVNPKYFDGITDSIFDDAKVDFITFGKIFKGWTTVRKEDRNESYIFLKMDANLYDFLSEYDFVSNLEKNEQINVEAEYQILKDTYNNSDKSDLQEYVLIPRNVFNEIVDDEKKKKKFFDEVLDLSLSSSNS